MPDDTGDPSDADDTEIVDAEIAGDDEPTQPDTGTWKAPSAALVPVERPAADDAAAPEPKRHGSVLWPVLAGIAIALLVALCVLSALLWNRVDDLEADAARNQTSTAEIDAAAKSASASAVEPVQDAVADLKDQLGELQQTLDVLRSTQAGAASNADIAALATRLESVITCVNNYMDVVSRADNANTSYVYETCR